MDFEGPDKYELRSLFGEVFKKKKTYLRICALSRLLDRVSRVEHLLLRMERFLLAFRTCSFPSWVEVTTSV